MLQSIMGYGYPPRCLPHGILGNVAKHYGIWVPPQVWTDWKHYLPHPSDAAGNYTIYRMIRKDLSSVPWVFYNGVQGWGVCWIPIEDGTFLLWSVISTLLSSMADHRFHINLQHHYEILMHSSSVTVCKEICNACRSHYIWMRFGSKKWLMTW